MQNYFNYYTEIEEHFQRRRGTLLMLSTLDWALIAAWQEAGIPLEAVLRGVDATFEKYATRKNRGRTQRVNGLAYCAQEIMRATKEMHAAATGALRKEAVNRESGFEDQRVADYLRQIATELKTAGDMQTLHSMLMETAQRLREWATVYSEKESEKPSLEILEQRLLALEDQIYAALQTHSSAETLMTLREQSARELAPYRSRLDTTQIRQIEQQFLRRCLLQQYRIPRLSLFYMRQT